MATKKQTALLEFTGPEAELIYDLLGTLEDVQQEVGATRAKQNRTSKALGLFEMAWHKSTGTYHVGHFVADFVDEAKN